MLRRPDVHDHDGPAHVPGAGAGARNKASLLRQQNYPAAPRPGPSDLEAEFQLVLQSSASLPAQPPLRRTGHRKRNMVHVESAGGGV